MDFRPGDADEATLARYGFPVGKSEQEQALITKVLARLGEGARFLPPQFHVLPPRKRRRTPRKSPKEPGVKESERSEYWAGVVPYHPIGDYFRWVTTEFTVPNVAGTAAGTAGYSSHWVGIDGYTEDDAGKQLCQCGVECDSTQKGVSIPYLWVEWVPGPLIVVSHPDFKLSPGDLLGVTLCTTGRGATTATAAFVNLTTGAAGCVAVWRNRRVGLRTSAGRGSTAPTASR